MVGWVDYTAPVTVVVDLQLVTKSPPSPKTQSQKIHIGQHLTVQLCVQLKVMYVR